MLLGQDSLADLVKPHASRPRGAAVRELPPLHRMEERAGEGPGRGGTFLLERSLLGPFPIPASWGEEETAVFRLGRGFFVQDSFVVSKSILQLLIKPGTGVGPRSFGSAFRNAEHPGRVHVGQAGEEAELD